MQIAKYTAGITGMFTAPEVIAVFSAAIVTPIIAPYVQQWVAKIPFLQDHLTIATLLFAAVIFIIANRVNHGMVRAIMVGVAGAFLLIGLAPFITPYLKSTVVP